MEVEFGHLEGVEILVDDFVIWGRNAEEHDARLEKFFDHVRDTGLKLNEKKSRFNTDRVSYVGHVLTSEGLEPSPERIQAIIDMPDPNDKAALQTFLGMVTYLGKFVPNLSKMTAPLRELTEKGVAWSWEERHARAAKKLKQVLTKTPVLKFYDAKLPVTLATDASTHGLGAVIEQENKPVAFAS
jgi:hypothetical protein